MSGTTEHTPGPWKFSFESISPEWAIVTTSGGAIVANVNADHRQEANARLIAAAPDMREELEKARGAVFLLMGLLGASDAEKTAACASYDVALAKGRGEVS